MSRKNCKTDEIMNPKTGRCVKKNGKIGKLLVSKKAEPVIAPTTTQKQTHNVQKKKKDVEVIDVRLHSQQPCDFKKTLEKMFPNMSKVVIKTFHVMFKKYITALVQKLDMYVTASQQKYPRVKEKDIVLITGLCFDMKIPTRRHTHSELYPCILSCLSHEMHKQMPHTVYIDTKAVETLDALLTGTFKHTRNSQIEKFVNTFYYDTENMPRNDIFKKLFMFALSKKMSPPL